MNKTCLMAMVYLLSLTAAMAAEPQSVLHWSDLPPLPGTVGLGGAFIGVQQAEEREVEVLIVAGGANFPAGNRFQEDGKVWHDDVYVLERGGGQWLTGFKLDRPLAYGGSVSTKDGVILIGGNDGRQTFAEVSILSWNAATQAIGQTSLPPLPRPSASIAAEKIGGRIYVMGGLTSLEPASIEKHFWVLELNDLERGWRELEAWPGPPRIKAQTAVQSGGSNKTFLYLIGGEYSSPGEDGDVERHYLADGYRYDPAPLPGEPAWKRMADLPDRPLAAGMAIDAGQSHVLVFGGSSGRYIARPVAERPPFPKDILAYHTITDTWTPFGELAEGVVTTRAVKFDGGIVIPSGESRPGVRTPEVRRLEIKPPKGTFGAVNTLILVAYLAALVGMGIYFSRREKDSEDYFVAGRRIPWWAAGLSIYATQLSAITFVATPAVGYANDWLIYPGKICIFLMVPVVITFYLPFFRRLNLSTAYEYLERRFHLVVRLYGTLSFTCFQFVRMGIVVFLPALALTTITGMNIYFCILLMGVLAILYTTMGGIEAVVWTDVLQVVVLVGGMVLCFIIVVWEAGGVAPIFNAALADGKLRMFDWRLSGTEMVTVTMFLGTFLLQFGPYTTDQAVIQRYMTTKDEKAAAKSLWANGLISLPSSLLFFVMGSCMYYFFKNRPEMIRVGMLNDEIYPLFVANHLPTGVSGLVIAGIFAASMSTLDSGMHSVATALTNDFWRRFKPGMADKEVLKVARWLTVAAGAAGTAVALVLAGFDIKSLFFLFQKMLGLISSGLVGVFILGVFTRRANAFGVCLGAAASVVLLYFVTFHTPIQFYIYPIIGISTCVIVGYVASLLTPQWSRDVTGLTYATLVKPKRSADN